MVVVVIVVIVSRIALMLNLLFPIYRTRFVFLLLLYFLAYNYSRGIADRGRGAARLDSNSTRVSGTRTFDSKRAQKRTTDETLVGESRPHYATDNYESLITPHLERACENKTFEGCRGRPLSMVGK